jgi:trimeric autotransporter adhesin
MTSGGLNFTWTLVQTSGPGSSGGSGSSISSTITIPPGVLPTTPGTYTYTLTVTDGTCTQTANFTLVVDAQPVAGTITVTPDPPATQLPLCPGQDAVLTLNGQSVPGLVQWYSSTNPNNFFVLANMISTGNTTQNTNPLNTTTYFGVQVSSLNGVCPPDYTIVQVPVKPPHGPVTISGPSIVCVNASATLNVASGSAGCTSFQWYCDGAPCGSNSPSMTVIPFTNYTDTDPVNYQLDCFDGCSTVSSNIITIQPDLLAVDITGPCCPCKGQKIQLCAQPVNGTPQYQYLWSPNAGGVTTQCTLVIPNNTTTYSVTVHDANNCHASNSFTATVCP